MIINLKLLAALVSLFLLTAMAKPTSADDTPLPPKLSAPVQELADRYHARLQAARYLAQNPQPVTYPGYEGLPLVQCRYSVTDREKPGGAVIGQKTASVILLNPSAEQLARWIIATCLEVKGSSEHKYTDKLFSHIISASGGQWPVAGIVYEDILPEDGKYEIYCFRDGVTVCCRRRRTSLAPFSQPKKRSSMSLHGKVLKAFTYARIQSTTRGRVPEKTAAKKLSRAWPGWTSVVSFTKRPGTKTATI